MSSKDPPALPRRQRYAAVVLAALVVGAVFAPTVYGARDGPDGVVAVVTIKGPVVGSTADNVEDELREIRANESVEAVVLKIDTPGGAPAASERMYTSIQRTSREMPLINVLVENGHEVRVYNPEDNRERSGPPGPGGEEEGLSPVGKELADADAFVTFRTDYSDEALEDIETFASEDGRVLVAVETGPNVWRAGPMTPASSRTWSGTCGRGSDRCD